MNPVGNRLVYGVSQNIANERDQILRQLQNDEVELEYLSDEWKADREVVLVAVKKYGEVLEFVSEALKDDKEIVLESVKQNGLALEYVSERLKDDFDVVFSAVTAEPLSLEDASTRLKRDEKIILEALEGDYRSIDYISEELKNDSRFMILLASYDYRAVQYANRNLRLEKSFILELIEYDIRIVKYLENGLRNSAGFQLQIVKIDPRIFYFCTDEIRGDREIAFEAIRKIGWLLGSAADLIRRDKKIVMSAVKQNGVAIQFASPQLRDDEEVVKAAISENQLAIAYVSTRLQSHFAVRLFFKGGVVLDECKKLFEKKRGGLSNFYEELVFTEVLRKALIALKEKVESRSKLTKNLWEEKKRKPGDFICHPNKIWGPDYDAPVSILNISPEEVLGGIKSMARAFDVGVIDEQEVLCDVSQYGIHLKNYEAYLGNRRCVIAAVRQNGIAIKFASFDLQDDLEVVRAAVVSNSKAYNYASERIRNEYGVDPDIFLESTIGSLSKGV